VNAELELEDVKLDTPKLRDLLRRKFPADQYAMLYEVRDAAGFQASRSADVMMVGLWPSRGNMLEGFELKVSRSDWLRELKQPKKADAFFKFCDRWWVVAGHGAVVKLDELPEPWGLMVAKGNGLSVVRMAPPLKPEPVDRSLLAAMLKRATDTAADSPEVRQLIEKRVTEATKKVDDQIRWATARLTRDNEELKKAIDDFQEESGVEIRTYRGVEIGKAVKVVLKGEHEWRVKELQNMHKNARDLVRWMDENIPSLPSQTAPDANR
jgi:hypothetical protein